MAYPPRPLNQEDFPVCVLDGTSARGAACPPVPQTPALPETKLPTAEVLAMTPTLGHIVVSQQQREALDAYPDLWRRIVDGMDRDVGLSELSGLTRAFFRSNGRAGGVTYDSAMGRMYSFQYDVYFEKNDKVTALYSLYDLYDSLCEYEYATVLNESLKPSFGLALPDGATDENWRYYQWIRPFYVRNSLRAVLASRAWPTPARELNDALESTKFLGFDLVVHREMVAVLTKAERELISKGAAEEVRQAILSVPKGSQIGGFVPRRIAGKNELSNHALGRAIDVMWDVNLHFKGETAKAIDDVLDWLQSQGLAGDDRLSKGLQLTDACALPESEMELMVSRLRQISASLQKFLQDSLDTWESLNALMEDYKKVVKTIGNGAKSNSGDINRGKEMIAETERQLSEKRYQLISKLVKLNGLRQVKLFREKGIVTVPSSLFVAMRNAGAKSGVEWNHEKDVMHFEVPPPKTNVKPIAKNKSTGGKK